MEIKSPAFIPKTWDLPPAIRARLGDQAGRQRLMDENGHLLIILHELPSAKDDQIRKPILFWCNAEGEWRTNAPGNGLAALEAHLITFRDRISQLDDLVDAAKSPHDYFHLLREVNPLLRSTRSQLSVMMEARKARPQERKLIILRDMAVENERGIDLIANDAKSGMDFSLAISGEKQAKEARIANQEAQRLNHLVAFFFPLATLATLFGMNDPHALIKVPGFWNILAVGIAFGLLLAVLNRMLMGLRRRD